MNDFELNKAIAEALYPLAVVSKFEGSETEVFIHHSTDCDPCLPWVLVKDYVNNWNDLMPLEV